MRFLTTIMSCLLSLFGCHDKVTTTSITRISAHGMDQLFSRTSVRTDGAWFECVSSDSGRCYYQVFHEACDGQQHCERSALQQFDVRAGQRQKHASLPPGFKSCVATTPAARCQ